MFRFGCLALSLAIISAGCSKEPLPSAPAASSVSKDAKAPTAPVPSDVKQKNAKTASGPAPADL